VADGGRLEYLGVHHWRQGIDAPQNVAFPSATYPSLAVEVLESAYGLLLSHDPSRGHKHEKAGAVVNLSGSSSEWSDI
jgi:hypothetical protein